MNATTILLVLVFGVNAALAGDVKEALKQVPHKIVCESYVGDNWELTLMNADGSGARNLTNTKDQNELYRRFRRTAKESPSYPMWERDARRCVACG